MARTKSTVLTLRISEEESEQLRATAEAAGVSVSELVRGAVHSRTSTQSPVPVARATSENGGTFELTSDTLGTASPAARWETDGLVAASGNQQTLIVKAPRRT